MRIHGLLFDKDGTLFDFEASWSDWAAGVFSKLADLADGDATALAGKLGYDMGTRRFDPSSPVIAGTMEEMAQLLSSHLDGISRAELIERMNADAAAAAMVPVADLNPLLAEFRGRGLKLGVATNAAETEAMAHLEASGLGAAFDFVAGYDSGYGAKPDPGMCRAFAEALALDPSAVAMVGDSLHDLRAGRAAGMQVVGVLTGVATEAELAPHADAVLPDITHLPAWLDLRVD